MLGVCPRRADVERGGDKARPKRGGGRPQPEGAPAGAQEHGGAGGMRGRGGCPGGPGPFGVRVDVGRRDEVGLRPAVGGRTERRVRDARPPGPGDGADRERRHRVAGCGNASLGHGQRSEPHGLGEHLKVGGRSGGLAHDQAQLGVAAVRVEGDPPAPVAMAREHLPRAVRAACLELQRRLNAGPAPGERERKRLGAAPGQREHRRRHGPPPPVALGVVAGRVQPEHARGVGSVDGPGGAPGAVEGRLQERVGVADHGDPIRDHPVHRLQELVDGPVVDEHEPGGRSHVVDQLGHPGPVLDLAPEQTAALEPMRGVERDDLHPVTARQLAERDRPIEAAEPLVEDDDGLPSAIDAPAQHRVGPHAHRALRDQGCARGHGWYQHQCGQSAEDDSTCHGGEYNSTEAGGARRPVRRGHPLGPATPGRRGV